MKKYLVSLVFFPCLFFVACQSMSSPSERKVVTVDTVFTQAYSKCYGAYYPSLDRQVFSLDLYSRGITLSGDTLCGTGTHLYFSDIFLPSEMDSLSEGTYRVDTTGSAFSALSGQYFEGNITGATLLLWKEAILQSVYLFPTGSLSLRQQGDTSVMEFHLKTQDAQTFDATYRGVIQYQQ